MSEQQVPDQDEQQRRISYWLSVMLRGLTLRHPAAMKIHGHRDTLYVQAQFPKEGVEQKPVEEYTSDELETADIIFHRTPNFSFNPGSDIEHADFGGEWPPRSAIQEQIKPKIMVPGAAETSRILKEGRNNV